MTLEKSLLWLGLYLFIVLFGTYSGRELISKMKASAQRKGRNAVAVYYGSYGLTVLPMTWIFVAAYSIAPLGDKSGLVYLLYWLGIFIPPFILVFTCFAVSGITPEEMPEPYNKFGKRDS